MLKNKGRTEDKTNKLGEITIINDVSLLAFAKTYYFSDVSAPIAVIVALTPHMRLLRSPNESVCPPKNVLFSISQRTIISPKRN